MVMQKRTRTDTGWFRTVNHSKQFDEKVHLQFIARAS
jgi:hypothetical protein